MKSRSSSTTLGVLISVIGLNALLLPPLFAQTAAAPSSKESPAKPGDDSPVVLSPFQVSTNKDAGYRATNSISGTRLDTSIKDTPMPIEVITRNFLDDTGATDLRSALRYSAGIILQSQNDLSSSSATAYQGPGGVNNPEGATANPNSVQIKVRGFVTDNALRDGFIRQNSTDSVNLARVEVVRGPAALLYGTGNFGGVVNYLVQQPGDKPQASFNASYGSYAFIRGEVNVTAPITADKKLAFIVTGALQSTDDQTQYFKESHAFVSPAITWRPTEKTEIYLDVEAGKQKTNGIGARQVRSVADVGINNDQNEHGGLYTPPGADPREYRLTGPDTYLNSTADNIELKFTQQIVPGINFLAGFNHSDYDSQLRDVQAQLFTNVGPAALRQTITLRPLDASRGDGSLNIQNGVVPNSILQYTWNRLQQESARDQLRTELSLQKIFFEGRSKWLRWDNQVLAGYSNLYNDLKARSDVTVPNSFNYKAPNDLSPLRFSQQGDGTATVPMFRNSINEAKAWNKAFYASYQAKVLDDRLLILVGARRDANDAWNSNTSTNAPGTPYSTSVTQGVTQKQTSYQKGFSVKLTDEVSFYALESEGLQPNFSGQVLPDTGAPAGASLAKSREIGFKFDLMKGRISGTISKYTITKTGYIGAPWYSPVTLGKPNFNPSKDIVYNVSNFSPTQAPGGSNGGSTKLDTGAAYAAWQAGVAAGSIFQSSAGNGSLTWYVDASKPEGAAYLDAAFAANQADNGAAWPGFLYQGESGDSLVNNATMDTMAFHGGGSNNATLLLTDRSKGYDAQFLFKVTDNFELILNGAITEVERLNFGQWMKYPYLQDRWAVWNFQNGSWGLLSLPASQIYGTPATATSGPDTSTRTGAGQAAGDDTPKYHFDLWSSYHFQGALKGLTVGLGGYWESKRAYMSGVTHGSGQLILDNAGKLLVLYTPSRYDVDVMARYEWKSSERRSQYVQLNVGNVFNDQDLYGLVYSAPLNARLTYGMKF